MANVVGTKGQVVINKVIRQRLGIEAGWLALQRIVDDHIEIYFLPPEHNRSLKGILAPYIKKSISPGKEWDEARQVAWEWAARDQEGLVEEA